MIDAQPMPREPEASDPSRLQSSSSLFRSSSLNFGASRSLSTKAMTGIQIPKLMWGKKTFDQYKNEILAWQTITKIRKEDQGVYIALSLPDCDESKIREQVFESHG